jgi:circadian clock protein KaiC
MSSTERRAQASTGVGGLDQLLHGGLPRDRMHLIEGEPGTGKTTLALQFLLEGRRLGENGLYVTLSETTEELHHVAASHGWSLDGVVTFQLAPIAERAADEYTLYHPAEIELSDLTKSVLDRVQTIRPTRVVFDSLSELRLLARDPLRYRRQILGLKDFFSRHPSTVLLLDDHSAGDADLQLRSLAHGVLLLEHLPFEYGRARRRLRVVKLRGTAVMEGFHDFIIARGGLTVFPQLNAGDAGRARPPFSRRERSSRARRAAGRRAYLGYDNLTPRSGRSREIDRCRTVPLRRGESDKESGRVSVRRAARHLRGAVRRARHARDRAHTVRPPRPETDRSGRGLAG